MLKFPLEPEYCLILNAFNQAPTLRAAAILLGTEPASLVRKVQRLSHERGLLQKVGNRWFLTEQGRRIAQWTEETLNSQKLVLDEKPRLRIASFTWLAEEMLIPHFARLNSLFANKHQWSFRTVAADLEQELIHSRTDFIVTGHAPNDPSIAHRKVVSLPWVVIAPKSWSRRLAKDVTTPSVLKKSLQELPFIRHASLNPEQVLDFKPETTADFNVDGVIGLRAAAAAGFGWTALPAMSIQSGLKNGDFLKLPLETQIKDDVCLWWLRSRKDSSEHSKLVVRWLQEFTVL